MRAALSYASAASFSLEKLPRHRLRRPAHPVSKPVTEGDRRRCCEAKVMGRMLTVYQACIWLEPSCEAGRGQRGRGGKGEGNGGKVMVKLSLVCCTAEQFCIKQRRACYCLIIGSYIHSPPHTPPLPAQPQTPHLRHLWHAQV